MSSNHPWWLDLNPLLPKFYNWDLSEKKWENEIKLDSLLGKLDSTEEVESMFSAKCVESELYYPNAMTFSKCCILESEHMPISSDNPNLACIYTIERVGYTDLVSDLVLDIDENVKKVFLAVGGSYVWKKEISAEDLKENKLSIGNGYIPMILLPYYKVSVVVVTDLTSRTDLFESNYVLRYNAFHIPYEITKQINSEDHTWLCSYNMKISPQKLLV